jgi:hypothetical protein
VNQTAPSGICCIKKFSGVIPPDPYREAIRVWREIQEKQQGRDKKEVKGQNRGGEATEGE